MEVRQLQTSYVLAKELNLTRPNRQESRPMNFSDKIPDYALDCGSPLNAVSQSKKDDADKRERRSGIHQYVRCYEEKRRANRSRRHHVFAYSAYSSCIRGVRKLSETASEERFVTACDIRAGISTLSRDLGALPKRHR
jgi:hypothetical protein